MVIISTARANKLILIADGFNSEQMPNRLTDIFNGMQCDLDRASHFNSQCAISAIILSVHRAQSPEVLLQIDVAVISYKQTKSDI